MDVGIKDNTPSTSMFRTFPGPSSPSAEDCKADHCKHRMAWMSVDHNGRLVTFCFHMSRNVIPLLPTTDWRGLPQYSDSERIARKTSTLESPFKTNYLHILDNKMTSIYVNSMMVLMYTG